MAKLYPNPVVVRSCQYTSKIRAMMVFAKHRCLEFCIKAGFVEIEPAHTGSSAPSEQIKVKRCFNVYFDKWDKPDTYTTNSGETHIWNFTG